MKTHVSGDVGFGGDRNADHGTAGQRGLPPHVCGYPTSAVMIIVAETRGEAKAMMIALVLELCGGVCAFSTIVFLALASVSKLMPDLERDETAPSA
jgi:hypothetical protein